MMRDFTSYVDRVIRDAIEAGEFSNLPGEGKPLNLDEDSGAPEHLRLAHKILKDNNLAPDWIMARPAIESLRAALTAKLQREIKTQKRRSLEVDLESIVEQYREAARRFNKKVLGYNLKVPPGVAHMAFFEVDREARRALEQSD